MFSESENFCILKTEGFTKTDTLYKISFSFSKFICILESKRVREKLQVEKIHIHLGDKKIILSFQNWLSVPLGNEKKPILWQ